MFTTYKSVLGDTFASIARRAYGDDTKAFLISFANPYVNEPLMLGTLISVPPDPDAPTDEISSVPSSNSDEVGLTIGGKPFRFWERISIRRSIDSVSTVSFSAPFEYENEEFRKAIRPFSYRDVSVTIGGNTEFSGTLVGVNPNITPERRSVVVQCYSKAGVLSDCTSIKPEEEYSDQTIEQIIKSECAPFGISVDSRIDSSNAFEKVAIPPTAKIMTFFASLASQRGVLLSDNQLGNIVLWGATKAGRPVATLRQGESPVTNVSSAFNPQQYYTVIRVIKPIAIGEEESQAIRANPIPSDSFRPITFIANDVNQGDAKNVLLSKFGRMFANVASYQVEVATWRDANGNLWKPNTTIKLIAKDAFVYKEYEFLVKSVVLNADSSSRTATLDLCFREAYAYPEDPYSEDLETIPESMPWD